MRLEEGRVGELRLGVLTKEANAEADLQRKRALMDKSRATDLVVRDILLRGEGDKRYWKVDEARAGTQYGGGVVSGRVETRAPYTLDAKAQFEGLALEKAYKANRHGEGDPQEPRGCVRRGIRGRSRQRPTAVPALRAPAVALARPQGHELRPRARRAWR